MDTIIDNGFDQLHGQIWAIVYLPDVPNGVRLNNPITVHQLDGRSIHIDYRGMTVKQAQAAWDKQSAPYRTPIIA